MGARPAEPKELREDGATGEPWVAAGEAEAVGRDPGCVEAKDAAIEALQIGSAAATMAYLMMRGAATVEMSMLLAFLVLVLALMAVTLGTTHTVSAAPESAQLPVERAGRVRRGRLRVRRRRGWQMAQIRAQNTVFQGDDPLCYRFCKGRGSRRRVSAGGEVCAFSTTSLAVWCTLTMAVGCTDAFPGAGGLDAPAQISARYTRRGVALASYRTTLGVAALLLGMAPGVAAVGDAGTLGAFGFVKFGSALAVAASGLMALNSNWSREKKDRAAEATGSERLEAWELDRRRALADHGTGVWRRALIHI